jgi:hypothetical protein
MSFIRQFAASTVLGAAVLLAGGCSSSDRPGSVPVSAQELGSGREEVTFNAANDGTVYVVDDTRKEVLYTGRVKRGDMLKVDAKGNKVTVNNITVTERDLLNDHRFKVFFEPSPEPRTAETTIRTDPNARTTITTDPNAAQPAKTTITTEQPAAQPKTSVTTDPNTGKTTVTTDPNAPAQPAPKTTVTAPEGSTVTTDPNTGTTTIKKE